MIAVAWGELLTFFWFFFLSNLTTPMEPKCSATSSMVIFVGRPVTYTMSVSGSSNDSVSGLYAMVAAARARCRRLSGHTQPA